MSSAENSDRDDNGAISIPIRTEDDAPAEGGGLSLPSNPELDQAVQEALASIESKGKKADKTALEVSKQERESLQTRIKDLHLKLFEKERDIEEKTKQIEEFKDQAARRQADLENYKKRVQKEKADQFNYGNEEIAREFLDVLDNLERALAHGKADAQGLIEGLELTRKHMEQVFQKFGVTPIESIGKRFDPNIHQAIAQVPSADHEAGTVIHEQQRGYRLKDRLLRPAMVVVAGAPDNK